MNASYHHDQESEEAPSEAPADDEKRSNRRKRRRRRGGHSTEGLPQAAAQNGLGETVKNEPWRNGKDAEEHTSTDASADNEEDETGNEARGQAASIEGANGVDERFRRHRRRGRRGGRRHRGQVQRRCRK